MSKFVQSRPPFKFLSSSTTVIDAPLLVHDEQGAGGKASVKKHRERNSVEQEGTTTGEGEPTPSEGDAKRYQREKKLPGEQIVKQMVVPKIQNQY